MLPSRHPRSHIALASSCGGAGAAAPESNSVRDGHQPDALRLSCREPRALCTGCTSSIRPFPSYVPLLQGWIRMEEVAKAVGGCYCRLQMPLSLALAVKETLGIGWAPWRGGGACKSTKRSTHARLGMHMQQCSAVPLSTHSVHHELLCMYRLSHLTMLFPSISRVLSATTSTLNETVHRSMGPSGYTTVACCWDFFGQSDVYHRQPSRRNRGGVRVMVCLSSKLGFCFPRRAHICTEICTACGTVGIVGEIRKVTHVIV